MKIFKLRRFGFLQGNATVTMKDIPFIMEPGVHADSRGEFFESFKTDTIGFGFNTLDWCKQINSSSSSEGVFRGFHGQSSPYTQGKMIECVHGEIIDIIVDARPNSATFGQYTYFKLNDVNHWSLWVPRGFLHGFYSNGSCGGLGIGKAKIVYKCDNVYSPENDFSVNPNTLLKSIAEDNRTCTTIIDYILEKSADGGLELSDKDSNGMDYGDFMDVIRSKWQKEGKLWYSSPTITRI